MTEILKFPDFILWDGKEWEKNDKTDVSVRSGKVYVTAPEGVSFISLRWSGNVPLNGRVFGDTFERSYSDLEWKGITPERVMPWYCAIYDGKICEGFGVRVRPNALCFWQIDELGVTLTMDLRSGSRPALLEQELCAAELVHYVSEDRPFVFMKKFCQEMADKPIFPKEPVYGTNSWYYCYSPSNPDLIEKDAIFLGGMTSGVKNRPYTVVDCGWSESRNPQDPCPGTFTAVGSEEFGDMGVLAKRIKKHNVRPGLWLRPLCVTNGKEFPESMILRKVEPFGYPCMDPSQQEVLDIIGADVKRAVSEWGYELIKFDFTTYDLLGKFHAFGELDSVKGEVPFANQHKTTAQIIKDFYAVIAQNAGDAVIIGCDCIGHLGCGYFHLYRCGDDTSGQNFERTRRMGVNTLAFRLCQHKAFYDIDADCMGQTDRISWERNQDWLDLLAHSGTPLFVSIHPEKATEQQKEVLKEAFLLSSKQEDELEPLDFTDLRYPVRYLINGEEKRYQWLEPTGVTKFGLE